MQFMTFVGLDSQINIKRKTVINCSTKQKGSKDLFIKYNVYKLHKLHLVDLLRQQHRAQKIYSVIPHKPSIETATPQTQQTPSGVPIPSALAEIMFVMRELMIWIFTVSYLKSINIV